VAANDPASFVSFPAVMFPSSIQTHTAIPESVISPHEMARLECPTLPTVDQQGEYGHGGKPQAVLPQGGQGNSTLSLARLSNARLDIFLQGKVKLHSVGLIWQG
jgi:hypothetical protein